MFLDLLARSVSHSVNVISWPLHFSETVEYECTVCRKFQYTFTFSLLSIYGMSRDNCTAHVELSTAEDIWRISNSHFILSDSKTGCKTGEEGAAAAAAAPASSNPGAGGQPRGSDARKKFAHAGGQQSQIFSSSATAAAAAQHQQQQQQRSRQDSEEGITTLKEVEVLLESEAWTIKKTGHWQRNNLGLRPAERGWKRIISCVWLNRVKSVFGRLTLKSKHLLNEVRFQLRRWRFPWTDTIDVHLTTRNVVL